MVHSPCVAVINLATLQLARPSFTGRKTTNRMATVTPNATEAPEIKVNPKLTAAIKDYVNWKQSTEVTEGNKLANLRNLLTEEKNKGQSKARLNLLLLESGMKAPAASQLLILVFPKTEEAAAQLDIAEKHNAKLPKGERGNVIGFTEQVQIARGKSTVPAVLQAKADKITGKREARPGGNKSAAFVSSAGAAPAALTLPSLKAEVTRLMEKAEKDGLAPDEIGDAITDAVAMFLADESEEQTADAAE